VNQYWLTSLIWVSVIFPLLFTAQFGFLLFFFSFFMDLVDTKSVMAYRPIWVISSLQIRAFEFLQF